MNFFLLIPTNNPFTSLLSITEEISSRSFEYYNYGTGVGSKCIQCLAGVDAGMDL